MKTRDKILLGIYNHWPRLDDTIAFETGELAWIIHHGLDGWRQDGKWKMINYPANKGPNDETFLDKPLRDKARIEKELAILQASGCIKFKRPSGFGMRFDLQLLPEGLIRAEKLSSPVGRAELWYSENKNGIFGLVITIVVSIITAWITSRFATKGD